MAQSNIAFARPVDGALYLLKQGFKVFPLKPNDKRPAFNDWQKWADSATEEMVLSHAEKNETANWGVSCGPSELVVLDVDPAKSGQSSLEALVSSNGQLPETLTVKTQSGGLHFYFSGKSGNSVGKLGKGLDIRGIGGYVVAPGSKIEGRVYSVIRNGGVKPAPEFLLKLNEKKQYDKPEVTQELLIEAGYRNDTLAQEAGYLRGRGYSYEIVRDTILAINETHTTEPLPRSEVETIARSIGTLPTNAAKAAADFMQINPASGLESFTCNALNPKEIPFRDWVMRDAYVSGVLSVLFASGGTGKSTYATLEALAIVTGDYKGKLTGNAVIKKQNVWLYNLEDSLDEMKRKVLGNALANHIATKDLYGLHLTSGQDWPLILAAPDKDGVKLNQEAIEKCIDFIKKNNIGVFILDPFVQSHWCNENDNMQINAVASAFKQIAFRTNCAIGVVHHSRKSGNSKSGESADSRGASSLTDAARIQRRLTTMTEDDAKEYQIDKQYITQYVRLEYTKSNLSKPLNKPIWFQLASTTIGNPKPGDESFPGDSVGVIKHIDLLSITQERRKVQGEGEFNDMLNTAKALVSVNEKVTIPELYNRIQDSEEFSHLFAGRFSGPETFRKYLVANFPVDKFNVGGFDYVEFVCTGENRTRGKFYFTKTRENEDIFE